jgi:hypothetical protein
MSIAAKKECVLRVKKMDKSKYVLLAFVFIISLLYFQSGSVMASITNGDFSQDPPGIGWIFSNTDVYSDSTAWDGNGNAVLLPEDEEQASLSELYQDNIFLLPGETGLSFDILMYKDAGPDETDIFTASFGTFQYILKSSDISGSLYEETIVVDLTGWAPGPYTLSFQLDNDPDGIFTAVTVDNVKFIPAPGGLVLVMIGTFVLRKSRLIKI